jgi:hypothetical protein
MFKIEAKPGFVLIALDESAIDTFEDALKEVRAGNEVIIGDPGASTKIRRAKPGELPPEDDS